MSAHSTSIIAPLLCTISLLQLEKDSTSKNTQTEERDKKITAIHCSSLLENESKAALHLLETNLKRIKEIDPNLLNDIKFRSNHINLIYFIVFKKINSKDIAYLQTVNKIYGLIYKDFEKTNSENIEEYKELILKLASQIFKVLDKTNKEDTNYQDHNLFVRNVFYGAIKLHWTEESHQSFFNQLKSFQNIPSYKDDDYVTKATEELKNNPYLLKYLFIYPILPNLSSDFVEAHLGLCLEEEKNMQIFAEKYSQLIDFVKENHPEEWEKMKNDVLLPYTP